MKPLDWVAIVGAAAWIPQVLGWIARKLAKPSLRLVTGIAPEIGYTTFGTIFNLTCAISAEKKDAIIERVICTLEHERGQRINLNWVRLSETFSQISGPEGTAEVGKHQPAIALKVGTLILAEKIIGFNDRAFQEQIRTGSALVAERLALLRGNAHANPEQEIFASREFADLLGLWDRNFAWQEGRYTARVAINIVGVKKPTICPLRFTLSTNEIQRLRSNVAEVGRFQRDLIQVPAEPPTYNWNWVYPPFEKSA